MKRYSATYNVNIKSRESAVDGRCFILQERKIDVISIEEEGRRRIAGNVTLDTHVARKDRPNFKETALSSRLKIDRNRLSSKASEHYTFMST